MNKKKNGEQNKTSLNNIDLLDWFAGKSLVGLLSGTNRLTSFGEVAQKNNTSIEKVASRVAYNYAEAMLEEREIRLNKRG